MKLYELEKGDKFKLTGGDDERIFEFEKVDGMYSRCWDVDDNLFHFGASTPVTRIENN